MIVSVVRTMIVYLLVVFAMRLMGKRQIGELKPHELIITILISQIVTIPVQDNSMPLINSIIPMLTLVSLELFVSFLGMKSFVFRNVLQGRPVLVINRGVIDQKQLKRLRFTVDDLIDALRSKDVFDISTVEYAVIETNGTLTVLTKKAEQPPTCKDLKVKADENDMAEVLIIDGKKISQYFSEKNVDTSDVEKQLRLNNAKIEDVFLMTRCANKYTIIKRQEEKKK